MTTLAAQFVFIPTAAIHKFKTGELDTLYVELSELLGEPVTSAYDLVNVTLRGASPKSVKRLSDLGLGAMNISWVIAPRTLSHRIEKNQNLTPEETGRLLRFGKVLLHAIRVFGSKDKALRWLSRVHPELSIDLGPLALCQSEEGSILVHDRLNAIDHGFFA